MAQTQTSRSYFAKESPPVLIKRLAEKIEKFDHHLQSTGRIDLWRNSYSNYNRAIYKGGRLNQVGEQGEYTEIYINHFRNLLTHILNMVTEQPPTFDARAANTDYQSQSETNVGNNVLEYYNRQKGMSAISKLAVEDVLQFGDAYIYQGWDFSLGDPAMPDPTTPGKVIKQGDILFKNFTPLDVIFDYHAGLLDAAKQWYILRDFQNKWDLIERYPELQNKIIDFDMDKTKGSRLHLGGDSPDDLIPFYMFFHDRTDAMPDGRLFTFLGDDCWFVDSGLPKFYKTLPVYRLCASEQRGSGFGYSIAFDLLPCQQAVDGLYSTVITNQKTFGVQNITVPVGCKINVQSLTDGLNLIEYDPKLGKPEVLKLLDTPKEIFDFIKMLEAVQQTLSGMNSVARGNPEASLKSGSALALVQSMALQFVTGLQGSYVGMLQNLGLGTINILQDRATTPRMVEISGKSNKSSVRQFTKKDISNINRVIVDLGNPLSRTTAGRVQIADNLLQAGLVENAEQYLQVMSSGKSENMTEGKQSELLLIRSENEALADGQEVAATILDNPILHVTEHKSVIASPIARNDPKVVAATLKHIQQHIDFWRSMPPDLMQMMGVPPPPMPAPLPMPGPGGDMAAIPGALPAPGGKTPEAPPQPGSPELAAGKKVNMPAMPKIAGTEERFQPVQTGGSK